MSHIQQITLDLIPNGEMPILYASQYDAGRSFRANIVERKIPYTLDGTELISLTVRKGDGNLVTMDIANTFAGKTYIDFLSTEQMTAVSGSNFGELHLESNGVSIGTLNFYLLVEPAADEGGITSESEINNLRRQVNEMVDEEMDDYLLKTEAEETYATITDLETLSGVVDTKASASDLETLAGVVDTKASKTYVDNAVSPKADKTYVDTELDKKADKSDTYTKTQVDDIANSKANANDVYSKDQTYNRTEVDNKIAELPEPMIFKGTLGVGGTIETLPTASAENEGWTYKVITAGTYAGQTAKVGDSFTSDGSTWVLFPCGDTDTDTWRAIKVNGVEELGNGISSGSVDIVEGDNIHISFDGNGNKVEIEADTIDDTQALTTKSWSGKKTYDEIVNILPTGNASGSVANFNTSLALPMEITADVNASGGGGTPATPIPIMGKSAVNLVKCAKNMFDLNYLSASGITIQNGVASGTANDFHNAFNRNVGGVKGLKFSNGKKYALSFTIHTNGANPNGQGLYIGFRYTDGTNDNVALNNNDTVDTSYTIISNSSKTIQCIQISYVSVNNNIWYLSKIQLEEGSTASAFEQFNGSTTLINLGGTYYGGQLEIDKNGHRRFKVTHDIVDLGSLDWYKGTYVFYATIDNAKQNGMSIICSNYPTYTYGTSGQNLPDKNICGEDNYRIFIADSSYNDAAVFKNAMNGVKAVFDLQTPYYIDLADGEPINSLVGVNNVYADSGDVAVTYKKSIDDAIAELQALILS